MMLNGQSALSNLRRVVSALVFLVLTGGASRTAHAQSAPAPPPADGCPVVADGGLPFTATAGAKLLSSGASIFTHDGSNKTIVVHIPVSGTVIPADVATSLDGDDVSVQPGGGQSVDVQWTLHDQSAPLRRLAVKAGGAPFTIRALDLGGAACVRRQAAADVVDLTLPAHLGTLHLALGGDGTQLAASTDGNDRLNVSGALVLPALTGNVAVQGRFNAADAKDLTPLGALTVDANGLSVASANPVGKVIAVGGLQINLQQFALRMSRSAPPIASVTFTPVLSSSLPFSIGMLSSNVDGDGRLSLLCSNPTPIAFTSSSDVAVGSGPFKDLHVAIDPTSPAQLTCDGNRYTGFETVVALRWDNVLTGGPLKFRLAATSAGVGVTPLGAASFPDLDIGSDALGLRLHVAAPALSVNPASSRAELQIAGRVGVTFASAGISTVPIPLGVALRAAGANLAAVTMCAANDPALSRAGAQGPFALPLRLNCANGEVAGVASDGGEVALPVKAGGIHVKIPSFSFAFADRSLSPADLDVSVSSTGGGSVLDFPGGRLDQLKLSYNADAGLRVIGTASVKLPTGQDAMQALTIHDIAIGRRDTRLAILGVGHIEAPDFTIAGMRLATLTDGVACKDAKSPIDTTTFDAAAERVDVIVCARASLLPSFLTPMQTQSHVGDLASGGGIIPPGKATASLTFRGLVIGHDGVPVDDGSAPVTTCGDDTRSSGDLTPQEIGLLRGEQREALDCRVEAELDPNFALGPLELRHININMIRRLSDNTAPTRPQFRILALVKFGKYLSTDGGTSGVINAQFNNKRMVVAGRFADVVSVRFGVASAGIRGFTMDFSDQQRSFIAEGGQISAGGTGGVSTTTLYFSEIAFVEAKDKNGNFKISKLSAPIDVKRTGLGLLFRLVTDLGSTSFLHLFKLP